MMFSYSNANLPQKIDDTPILLFWIHFKYQVQYSLNTCARNFT